VVLQAFVLMVSLAFEKLLHKDEFLTFWAPLADHVKAHEPGTLAFELLQSDTKPTELLVYER
jgi:quinol monooxygenase YgiN